MCPARALLSAASGFSSPRVLRPRALGSPHEPRAPCPVLESPCVRGSSANGAHAAHPGAGPAATARTDSPAYDSAMLRRSQLATSPNDLHKVVPPFRPDGWLARAENTSRGRPSPWDTRVRDATVSTPGGTATAHADTSPLVGPWYALGRGGGSARSLCRPQRTSPPPRCPPRSRPVHRPDPQLLTPTPRPAPLETGTRHSEAGLTR